MTAAVLSIILASNGCKSRSPLEGKLIGTWGAPSTEGEIDTIYRPDHTWTATGADGPSLNGRWWIEDDQLVSEIDFPKEYEHDSTFAGLRGRKQQTIVSLTMKKVVFRVDGREFGLERMLCPRCGAKLGSFDTDQTMPSSKSACPNCGLKLDDT